MPLGGRVGPTTHDAWSIILYNIIMKKDQIFRKGWGLKAGVYRGFVIEERPPLCASRARFTQARHARASRGCFTRCVTRVLHAGASRACVTRVRHARASRRCILRGTKWMTLDHMNKLGCWSSKIREIRQFFKNNQSIYKSIHTSNFKFN